jgi:hypothetical protein
MSTVVPNHQDQPTQASTRIGFPCRVPLAHFLGEFAGAIPLSSALGQMIDGPLLGERDDRAYTDRLCDLHHIDVNFKITVNQQVVYPVDSHSVDPH